ncbi:MAG: alcohol dehydrogenase catalytic domain-containing protein [Acidimicrobiia bacterium]
MTAADVSAAMLLVGPRHFTPTSLRVPEVEYGGWLRIEATGISGVEVQAWKGTSRLVKYPLVPGHEVVGRIVADPTGAFGLELGSRVVVESNIRCGTCHRCRSGLSSCSGRRPTNAYGQVPSTEPPGLWGGLAEYLYLDPSARLHPVDERVPGAVAAFAHALAAGFTWAVETPSLRPGESVLVLGPGPRGLASLVAARAAGAGWVGVSGLGHDTDRLRLAEDLGADLVVDVSTDDLASSVADSLGTRPDVVVDVTSNDSEVVLTALDLVRPGGTVVLASTKGTNAIAQLFSDIIVLKELRLQGAFGASSTAYHWATRQIGTDDRLDRMVSHEFPLDEADRAIQATAGLLGHDQLISVAVTP